MTNNFALGMCGLLIALILRYCAIAISIRDDLRDLRIWDERSQRLMGYRPMYRRLSGLERIKVVLLPGLAMNIEDAYTNWRIQRITAGYPFVGPEPIFLEKEMIELTAMSRSMIRNYQGSPWTHLHRKLSTKTS